MILRPARPSRLRSSARHRWRRPPDRAAHGTAVSRSGLDRHPGERIRRRGLLRIRDAARRDRDARFAALFSTGVTRFFPTVITGTRGEHGGCAAQSRARQGDAARRRQRWRASTSRARTSRRRTDRAARIRSTGCGRRISTSSARWQDAAGGHVRLVTLSPEWPEAPRYIEHVVRRRRGGRASATPRPTAAADRATR